MLCARDRGLNEKEIRARVKGDLGETLRPLGDGGDRGFGAPTVSSSAPRSRYLGSGLGLSLAGCAAGAAGAVETGVIAEAAMICPWLS